MPRSRPSPLVHAQDRAAWRRWLAKHHARATVAWLVYSKKHTGKPRVTYGDAVEEALCFGWIDSTANPIDDDSWCQRFTPRRRGSTWSEPNLARARRMIAAGLMTEAGLRALDGAHVAIPHDAPVRVAPDIRAALVAARAWASYRRFPRAYQRIRIAWIEGARGRPQIFAARLRRFVAMTARNQRYGMVQE